MLRLLGPSVPEDMIVIVMSDRGIYARWLYRRILRLGWHPFMRINACGTFRKEGENFSRLIHSLVKESGDMWQGCGTAFKTKNRELQCTLLAYWEEGYDEPWLILTDLPHQSSNACWYGMRAWIEHGFRVTKRGGWQWHRTRMKDPARAERLWLAISIATIWLMSVGGEIDESIPESTIMDITEEAGRIPPYRKITKHRSVSVFRRGWIAILVSILFHDTLPFGVFIPEPWPEIPKHLYNKCSQELPDEKTYP